MIESVGVTQILGRVGRVPPLSPLLHTLLPLPGCCWGLGIWNNSPPLEAKNSKGCLLILPPWPCNLLGTAALLSQAGMLGVACKQTQPISSSPSDLSAQGKAKLSLDILLFILLGFPARRAGA